MITGVLISKPTKKNVDERFAAHRSSPASTNKSCTLQSGHQMAEFYRLYLDKKTSQPLTPSVTRVDSRAWCDAAPARTTGWPLQANAATSAFELVTSADRRISVAVETAAASCVDSRIGVATPVVVKEGEEKLSFSDSSVSVVASLNRD